MDNAIEGVGAEPDSPRNSVSRGLKLQAAFVGIDSLYIVLEYPRKDVYEFWSSVVADLHDPRLFEGIPFDDFLVRRGGLGYKLSVWSGDARLFITDRVEENLTDTPYAGHGMGVMLQLGPKWLSDYGDVLSAQTFRQNVLAQFAAMGVKNPVDYRARINRMDIALDVRGLPLASFSIDEWQRNWVGYANRKDFHISATTRELEGLSIGSSSGVIRFKIYDKVAEAAKRGRTRFWRSVWNIEENEVVDVARFEWSIKVYQANFSEIRYLSDYTFERLMGLLNYASLKWGRLCIPDPTDTNQSRWALAPLWVDIRRLIDDWTFNYDGVAARRYDLRPDLKPEYLRFIAGSIGGFMARVGIEQGSDFEANVDEALDFLKDEGLSIEQKAKKKWDLFFKLLGRKR